ncbi:prefoldin subunit 6-like [Saccoglossus kowalevskii]|uniref:Prefoldin subunit 6-like n=1 Tax=Saccoglossus kowalevskii TaxID=10224 RepID=A0ABM0GRI5_SACKO|nr:PREDICTED: prefoldin subunit 6-like [Saccoglossus kowalevskii]
MAPGRELEMLQKQLQDELDKLKNVQKDYQKALANRQQLDSQLNENKIVKDELDILEDDGKVFKLMGPVLVKQDVEEAKQNVGKRIEYISSELKRIEDSIKDLDKKQDTHRESLSKLQQKFQQAQMKQMTK